MHILIFIIDPLVLKISIHIAEFPHMMQFAMILSHVTPGSTDDL